MSDWQDEIERIHVQAVDKKILPWSPEDIYFLALALCGEAGEIANRIKKHWRGDDLPPLDDDPELIMELADVRIYLHLLATACAVNLDEAVQAKLPEIRRKFLHGKEQP